MRAAGSDTRRAMLTVAAKLGGAALGLALNVVVARSLDLAGYGVFLLGFTLAMLLSAFVSAGLPFSALRFLPGYLARGEHARAARFRRLSLAVTWAGSGLFLMVGLAGLALAGAGLEPGLRAALLAALPLVLVLGLGQTYAALLQARMRAVEAELIFNLLRPVLTVAGVLALLAAAPGRLEPWLALSIVTGAAALAVVGLALCLRRIEAAEQPRAEATYDAATGDDWRAWVGSGAVMMLILSGAALNERLDILMVSLLAGSTETAIYGAASRWAVVTMLVVAGVGAQYLPRFSEAWGRGDQAAAQRHAVAAARVSGAMALAVLGLAVLAGPWALALFGPAYAEGQATLVILAAAFFGVALFGLGGGIPVVAGRPGVALAGTALGLSVNLGLNLLLTPRFGSEGAAAATLVALSVAGVFFWVWCRRALGLSTAAFAGIR